MSTVTQKLYRSRSDRMIAGACAGLGKFFGIDATVVRLAYVLLAFLWPPMVIVYLVLMLIVPAEPQIAPPPAPQEEIIEPPQEQ